MADTRIDYETLSKEMLNNKLSLYLYYSGREPSQLPLDEKSLIEIELLLKYGADVNLQNKHGRHILFEAIYNLNIELIKLAIKYDADVNLHYIPTHISQKQDGIMEYAIKDGCTMLQAILEKYYSCRRYELADECNVALKCYDLLMPKFAIPEEYKISSFTLNEIYQNLYKMIQNKKDTQKESKPLLIILGERHTSCVSLFLEVCMLLIGKEIGIKTLLHESTKQRLELQKAGRRPPTLFDWVTSNDLVSFAMSLEYENYAVDLGCNGARKIGDCFDSYEADSKLPYGYDNSSEVVMKYRDDVMHSVISEGYQNEAAILIVGSNHLLGLGSKEFLHHDTLLINTTDLLPLEAIPTPKTDSISHDELAKEFITKSGSVLSKTKLQGMDFFWHPPKVIDEAKKLHTFFKKNM